MASCKVLDLRPMMKPIQLQKQAPLILVRPRQIHIGPGTWGCQSLVPCISPAWGPYQWTGMHGWDPPSLKLYYGCTYCVYVLYLGNLARFHQRRVPIGFPYCVVRTIPT